MKNIQEEITDNIAVVNNALKWADKYGKTSFPVETFKSCRRRLKKIRAALAEKCSAASYGESQVGKSYLMSSLLSSPDAPFVISNGGKDYSFIDELNPSGGNNAKIESTGVITRFTINRTNEKMKDYVKVRNLSIVDLILLLTDSYYNDIKINPDTTLRYDAINKELVQLSMQWKGKGSVQEHITEDDIKDIEDYIHEIIGNNAISVNQSNFFKVIAPVITSIPSDQWVNVFCLLWNKNPELSHLFSVLIGEYKKINFLEEVYVPFDTVLRSKGTLLKIEWLDSVCGMEHDTGEDVLYTDVYDGEGRLVAQNFSKANLSALIAELTFVLPPAIAKDRHFLNDIDLLDFPGARSREKYKEEDIHSVLPKILRRGKVAYLFNKYSRSLRISSVLFCHHNDQKTEPTIGETINSWLVDNIGATPQKRAQVLEKTNGIAPLFMVATKFNIDLERTKNDTPETADKLDSHWNRFDTVLPEIIKPYKWLDEWVPGPVPYFRNIYLLRDFYWSGKGRLFTGYSDGAVKSPETGVYTFPDYPDYFEDLKRSFVNYPFVKEHFANPVEAWNDVATINNDGSKAIIRNLDTIAALLDQARLHKYLSELSEIKQKLDERLNVFYVSDDEEAKNKKVRSVTGDLRMRLMFSVGKNPSVFGQIIDRLMVAPGALRDIAYDIIIRKTDTPKDFSAANFIRASVGINAGDSREENLSKLCDYFNCEVKDLEEYLAQQGFTVDDIVSNNDDALTTVAGVVTKHILDYWGDHINEQVKNLHKILPHSDEFVFMLQALLTNLGVRKKMVQTIDSYSRMFELEDQPNAVADYASLVLNNFVSTVGNKYMTPEDKAAVQKKADACRIHVDLTPAGCDTVREPHDLKEALSAFDSSTEILTQDKVDIKTLRKLPLWDNFQRWLNLVNIGLIYSSDISNCDPEANAGIKALIEQCENLYTSN